MKTAYIVYTDTVGKTVGRVHYNKGFGVIKYGISLCNCILLHAHISLYKTSAYDG